MSEPTLRGQVAAVLAVLEQREATARESYNEVYAARQARADIVKGREYDQLRFDHYQASGRWTEAQEALAVVRKLAEEES
jgi:hypothetical protein